ncbi:MAG TPA: S8 family serine peptidase [Candidatus Saccharimonadales bacterium]|nr:S8 family serine peptidase [Candidatus Saccharimonadales bacterium]
MLSLLFGALAATAKDSLTWENDKNNVSAEIATWDLGQLLENVASATGWNVYVEPQTKYKVSTKFKDRTPGDALKLLLGDLSFALVPEKNGPSRLYVFRTTMKEATQLVKAAQPKLSPKAKPIPDELVVTVKPGTDIEALAKKLGAKIIGRADALNTYRLKFEDAESANAAKQDLKTNSSVENIDSNYSISRPDQPEALGLGQFAPIGLTPKAVPDANRLIVGLIDTPVQAKGTGIEGFLLPSISVGDPANPGSEQPTHGTSMAETLVRGMIAGLEGATSSKVRILPVDVYGNNASTTSFDVALGVTKAINGGAMWINMSLGSYGPSEFLQQVIQSGHSQGVAFFASAGNEPVTTPTYPAAYPEVVAVTAADRNGKLASYANYGSFVDVMAPGTAIVNYVNQSWLVMGTSPASVYATGMAVGQAEARGLSAAQSETAIRSSSVSRLR